MTELGSSSPAARWRLLYTGPRLISDWDTMHADLDAILAKHPRLLVRIGDAMVRNDAGVQRRAVLASEDEPGVGLGRTKSHEPARADDFPVPVLCLGKRYAVTKAAIFEGLGLSQLLTDQASPQAKTT